MKPLRPMKKMLTLALLLSALIAPLAVAAAPAALAVGAPCPTKGTIIDGDLEVDDVGEGCFLDTVTINGNLTVSRGAFADLEFSRVKGGVMVVGNGSLVVGHSALGRNLVARQSSFVDLFSSQVHGNVSSTGSRSGTSLVCDSFITGSLTDKGVTDPSFPTTIGSSGTGLRCGRNVILGDFVFSDNRSEAVVQNNRVDGRLLVARNASPGASRLSHNSVGGTLKCWGNTPAPVGGGNTASVKVGQCADL